MSDQALSDILSHRTWQDTHRPWAPDQTDAERLAILVEEVGEVAQSLQTGTGLRDELVQVAAVALRWVQAIDSRQGPTSGSGRL